MVYRVYVEKKAGFDHEAQSLLNEVRSLLGILDGTMPVYIRFVDTGKMVLAPRTLWALDHPLLYSELNRILGEENVAVR